ncbi:hypothetical protein ACJX0J_020522, partial [Zea mays]
EQSGWWHGDSEHGVESGHWTLVAVARWWALPQYGNSHITEDFEEVQVQSRCNVLHKTTNKGKSWVYDKAVAANLYTV